MKLEVGKRYIDNDGDVIEIVSGDGGLFTGKLVVGGQLDKSLRRWVFNAMGRAATVGSAHHLVRGADEPEAGAPEYTGGSVSYYTVQIERPTTPGRAPYTAECNDIIEALAMNYAEGNAFKAIWRRCAARTGKVKAGYKDGKYDAEKVVFFGQRMVASHEGEP